MADFANAEIHWGAGPSTITLLELLKSRLEIDPGDASRDDELSMYLEMAGAAAETYCDNVLDQRDIVERLAFSRTPLPLRYYPVSAVVSITIDGDDVSDQFELFHDEGISWSVKDRCGYTYRYCFDQMTVTYTAGFDPLPPEVGNALVQTALLYESDNPTGGPLKRESIVGVGSQEYDTSAITQSRVGMLPAVAVAALEPYRRVYA